MTTITLQVPEKLEKEHDETTRFLAAKLYEAGKITMGQAATMTGMKKWDFAEIMTNYGVNIYEQAFLDDLERMKDEPK